MGRLAVHCCDSPFASSRFIFFFYFARAHLMRFVFDNVETIKWVPATSSLGCRLYYCCNVLRASHVIMETAILITSLLFGDNGIGRRLNGVISIDLFNINWFLCECSAWVGNGNEIVNACRYIWAKKSYAIRMLHLITFGKGLTPKALGPFS